MPKNASLSIRRVAAPGFVLLCGFLAFWLSMPAPVAVLEEYWHFTLLGLLGATVANATGAGGGVVFIPSFTHLGLTDVQTLGTSILIQCFGMTAGSISWLLASGANVTGSVPREGLLKQLLMVCGLPVFAGVLAGQYLVTEPPLSMVSIFRNFSVFFGATLLAISLLKKEPTHTQYRLRRYDAIALVPVCFAGGALTSWISVAIGEFVALFLIFRSYPTMVAICSGVCMSSVAVLTAAYFHACVLSSVVWEIVLFAAPAAVIGGTFARLLSARLGPERLKIFFATWILVTGLIM